MLTNWLMVTNKCLCKKAEIFHIRNFFNIIKNIEARNFNRTISKAKNVLIKKTRELNYWIVHSWLLTTPLNDESSSSTQA